jgi:opacity protein-like surface antigen
MKFVLACLLLIMLAGAAYAADQPANANSDPAVVYTNADTGATPPPAEQPADTSKDKKKTTVFALTAGMYSPASANVRTVYGDHFLRLGLRPLPTNAPHNWRFAYDVNYITMSSMTADTLTKNNVMLIPVTAGFLRRFGKNDVKSYAAVNVGPYYGSVSIPDLGINEHGWGLDANLTFGTVFKERYCIEARYDLMNKFAGFDFSSLSLSVAMKVFTMKL